MKEVVFLLQEASAKAMLEGFLPKIVPSQFSCRFIVFEGKQDLERQMIRRMRGYLVPGARFVVLRDKDSEDCRVVKKRLKLKCQEAGRPEALVRIACHELESGYLADLAAVELALAIKGLARQQGKHPYDRPDEIGSPAQRLKALAPIYQKVGGSRAIGPHFDSANQKSRSFSVFVEGLKRIISSAES